MSRTSRSLLCRVHHHSVRRQRASGRFVHARHACASGGCARTPGMQSRPSRPTFPSEPSLPVVPVEPGGCRGRGRRCSKKDVRTDHGNRSTQTPVLPSPGSAAANHIGRAKTSRPAHPRTGVALVALVLCKAGWLALQRGCTHMSAPHDRPSMSVVSHEVARRAQVWQQCVCLFCTCAIAMGTLPPRRSRSLLASRT